MDNLNSEKNFENIIIKPSLKKILKMGLVGFFGSLFFLLMGLFIVYIGHIIFGVICILFSGYAFYLCVRYYMFKGVSEIYITKEGIKTKFFPMKKEFFIPWDAIKDVWTQSIRVSNITITTLYISLKNPKQFFEKPNNLSEKFLTSLSQFIVPKEDVEKMKEWTGKFDLILNDNYEIPISELASIIKSRIKK